MKRRSIIIPIIVLVIAGGAYYGYSHYVSTSSKTTKSTSTASTQKAALTKVQPASELAETSAAGNISIATTYTVMEDVAGIVKTVPVKIGDEVKKGDVLLTLDTTDLELAVTKAQLSLDSANASLAKLTEAPDPATLAAKQASVKSAEENYKSVLAGKTEDQLTSLAATYMKAKSALQKAQQDFDQVAYRGDIGSSSQAEALQEATITYQAALADYKDASKPATEADKASAAASLASAQADLESTLHPATDAELQAANITVKSAQIDLDEAKYNLEKATLKAPNDGIITEINASVGQYVSSDSSAFTIANMSDLELIVDVAEVDINKISIGQKVTITLDALSGQTFNGEVERITPSSATSSGVVNYPVYIKLTDKDLTSIKPGMTAVATFASKEAIKNWLVPVDAITKKTDGDYVTRVRDGKKTDIKVTTGSTQGEWIEVTTAELQSGDEVLGSTTSYLSSSGSSSSRRNGGLGFPGMGGPP